MAYGDKLREQHGTAMRNVRATLTIFLILAAPCGFLYTILAFHTAYFDTFGFYSFVLLWVILLCLAALIWTFDRKVPLICLVAIIIVCTAILVVDYFVSASRFIDQKETEETQAFYENIPYDEYLPFTSTKIARLEEASTLQFSKTDDLPVLDSASAFLPLCSAFVTAVYPGDISVAYVGDANPTDCTFQYNNSSEGFYCLADKTTDIFFGIKPSEGQVTYATDAGVEFEYAPIGREAFVFLVNADNPVNSLTTQQVRDIYSGKITNWSEVGGDDREIIAYQRNVDSGSQSQMVRFMGNVPLEDAPQVLRSASMGSLVKSVADYDNGPDAIGYSFRYYVTDLVAEYNVKLLAIEGVEPTIENIGNGSYPVTGDFYAVTRKGETNQNVTRLIDWIQSEQGQYLVEQSGYSRLAM